MVDFVIRFKDLALECYDEQDEGSLVEICVNNIIPDYRVYLENLNITQFTKLIEATRRTFISVKTPARVWRSEKLEDIWRVQAEGKRKVSGNTLH